MATGTGEASQEAETVYGTATTGLEVIERTERSVVRVREATADVSRAAGGREEGPARIAGISSMLRETADPINLLALNAAIQAARVEIARAVEGTSANLAPSRPPCSDRGGLRRARRRASV